MKKWIIFIFCIIFILLIFFAQPIVHSENITNVFDEIYYAFVQHPLKRYTWCNIQNMDIWHQETTPQKNVLYYSKTNLDFANQLSVSHNEEANQLFFILSVPLENGEFPAELKIVYLYTPKLKELRALNVMMYVHSNYLPGYDVKYDENMLFYITDEKYISPILKQNDVNREYIAHCQNYILMEKFLPDWFEANFETSNFSMENLGEYTVIDNTFAQLGENWGK